MCDPENPQGTWATWKSYLDLGERLLVLCRKGFFDTEMQRFKEAKLLNWATRVECEDWVEYHECMVLSYDWGGFITTPDCRALADALAPRTMTSVSLMGGLRDHNQNAWLEGFPPSMKVYGFDHQFELVVKSARGSEVFHEDVQCQQELPLPCDLAPDTYQIEVKRGDRQAAARIFRIVPWTSIQEHPEPEEVTNSSLVSSAGLSLRGAIIVKDDSNRKEVSHA